MAGPHLLHQARPRLVIDRLRLTFCMGGVRLHLVVLLPVPVRVLLPLFLLRLPSLIRLHLMRRA